MKTGSVEIKVEAEEALRVIAEVQAALDKLQISLATTAAQASALGKRAIELSDAGDSPPQ